MAGGYCVGGICYCWNCEYTGSGKCNDEDPECDRKLFWSVYQYFITGILNTRGSDHHWKVWGCDHWRKRCQTRLQYANMVCDVNLFRNWNGIVILGDWGPIFHYMQTPTAIGQAQTRTAGIFAVAQAMWDWSFIQYAMYAVCGAAFAVLCFNKGKSLSISSIVECVTNKKIPWLNTLVTCLVIFCLMGATANSMGVGLMQIGAGLETVFGIAQSPIVWILIAAFVSTIFILSCVSGIGKGLKIISSICMYFFIFLLIFVFIFGNTPFIGKITSEAIGFIIDHWGTQTMLMNAMAPKDTWFSEWSVMYWNSFIMYAPIIGMFLARMGKGRTIRTFMLVQVLVPSVFCIIWIGIFGGQTIFLQTSGTLDVWNAVQTSGMQATVFQILGSLPGSKIITVLFLCTITLSFCTLADPMASVASTLSVDGLSADDEPPKKQKVLVGIILAAVACTLVISGGTTAIKGMINLNGLLQSVVMILCAVAFFKSGKKEDNEHVD